MNSDSTSYGPDQGEQARNTIIQLWSDESATNRLFPRNDHRVKTSLLKAARKAIKKHSLNYRDTIRLVNRQRLKRLQDRRPGIRYGTWYNKQDFVTVWERDDPFEHHIDVSDDEVIAHGLVLGEDGILRPNEREQLNHSTTSLTSGLIEVIELDQENNDARSNQRLGSPVNLDKAVGQERMDEDRPGHEWTDDSSRITVDQSSVDTNLMDMSSAIDRGECLKTAGSQQTEIFSALEMLSSHSQVSSTIIHLLCTALCGRQTKLWHCLFVPVFNDQKNLTSSRDTVHEEHQNLIIVPLRHSDHWSVGFIDLKLRRIWHYVPWAHSNCTSDGLEALNWFAELYIPSFTLFGPTPWSEGILDANLEREEVNDAGIAIMVAIVHRSFGCGYPTGFGFDCDLWRVVFKAILQTIRVSPNATTTNKIPKKVLPDQDILNNLHQTFGKIPLPALLDKLDTLRQRISASFSIHSTLARCRTSVEADKSQHELRRREATTNRTLSLSNPDLSTLQRQMAEWQQLVSSWIEIERGLETRRAALYAAVQCAAEMHEKYVQMAKTLRVRLGLELKCAELIVKDVGARLQEYDASTPT